MSRDHRSFSESLRSVRADSGMVLNGLVRAAPKALPSMRRRADLPVIKRLVCLHGRVDGYAVNMGGTAGASRLLSLYFKG